MVEGCSGGNIPLELLIGVYMENKSVRFQALFTPEIDKRLKEVAERKAMSRNEIINKALAAYLKQCK